MHAEWARAGDKQPVDACYRSHRTRMNIFYRSSSSVSPNAFRAVGRAHTLNAFCCLGSAPPPKPKRPGKKRNAHTNALRPRIRQPMIVCQKCGKQQCVYTIIAAPAYTRAQCECRKLFIFYFMLTGFALLFPFF